MNHLAEDIMAMEFLAPLNTLSKPPDLSPGVNLGKFLAYAFYKT